MDITYEPIIIEVKDIRDNILCVLTNDEVNEYKINNIKEIEKINDVRSLEFNISPESENIKYLINENILSVGEDEYIIKVCNLQDDDSEQTYSVTAYGYESILKDKICGKYEIVADTPQNLITKVLENTGYIFGGTDISTNVQRHLFSENESVFSNLISIAENFNARLYFKTMTVNNIKTRSVSLYNGVINNGTYIEKGRDLTSVDIEYSTENMTTRLYVFGQTDKTTGTPINMMAVNPTGMAYIDNLSYFTNQGITISEIGKSPRFIKELVIENNELTTPQMVYNYGVEKIKELCVPSVECSVTAKDLHLIEEYMKTKPVIGETIYIYDEDINFVSTAIIIGISKDYDNPLESTYDISNVIVFNSTIKDLIDTGKVVEKVTNEQGKILGMYIADATIGNAQIGNAIIDNAKIQDATITNAKIHDLNADKITAGDITTDRLKANTIDAINAYIGTATIDSAKINNLNANFGKITILESSLATIDTLVNGHLTSNNIQSLNLTSDKVTVANGFIKDAMIDTLSVNKVLAGDISTNKFRIVSDSGKMLIADNTIQINDTNRTRVQIGKDDSNDYSMYVWDKSGNLMFDATGLKASGVKDKIIRNDMISDTANISGSKLDIASVITNINNDGSSTIKGSKVKLDETGQTLNVAFNSLTTSVNDIQVGGVNLLLKSNQRFEGKSYPIAVYDLAVTPIVGQTYTFRIKATLDPNRKEFAIYNSGGSVYLAPLTKNGDYHEATFKWVNTNGNTTVEPLKLYVFDPPNTNRDMENTNNIIEWAKLEVGNKATDWTPAIEDTMEEINNAVNNIQVGGRNLIVQKSLKNGYFVNNKGAEIVQGLWCYTDYITVEAGKQYIVSGYSNLGDSPSTCFYDSNKVFVSGIANINAIDGTTPTEETMKNDKRRIVTVPSGCVYMRFSLLKADLPTIKLEKGNKVTDWTPAIEDTNSKIESNTTSLNVALGKINTLVSNTTITKDGTTTQLKDAYTSTEQTVSGLSTTVASHTTTISDIGTTVESHSTTLEQHDKGISLSVKSEELEDAVKRIYGVEVDVTKEDIKTEMSKIYISKDEEDNLIEKAVKYATDQTAEGFEETFSTLEKTIKDVDGKIEEEVYERNSYIRRVDGKIHLGVEESDLKAVLDNDSLDFMQGGVVVSQITNQEMLITDALVKNKLSLGNTDRGYFDFVPRVNGNLSLKWRSN